MLNQYRLPAALLLFLLCFGMLYPAYRFIFDTDGIGYMMVAKRLAAGDTWNAINGYWSPLHSWLMAPFIALGVDGFMAFKISNACFSLGVLVWLNKLLQKTTIDAWLKSILLFTAVPLLLAYAFNELAADLLFVWLLLIYLDIASDEDLFNSTRKNILCGLTGCLCYFAKTYGFPLFLLHFTLTQWILYRNALQPDKRTLLIRNWLLGTGTFFLLAAPWLYVLYQKYHLLTFGYSGKLALQWEIFPRKTIEKLYALKPPYPGSPSGWEDPFYYDSPVETNHSLFSLRLAWPWLRKTLDNFMKWMVMLGEFSVFSAGIMVSLAVYLLKKRNYFFLQCLLLMILLQAGYLLVHVETRFFWAGALLLLICGAWLVQKALELFNIPHRWKILCWCIYFGSFLIYPMNLLKDSAGGGREVFTLAKALQDRSIKGNFSVQGDYSLVQRAAFLTGDQFWILSRWEYTYDELAAVLQQQPIDYFFFFYDNQQMLDAFRHTPIYKNAKALHQLEEYHLVIVKIK